MDRIQFNPKFVGVQNPIMRKCFFYRNLQCVQGVGGSWGGGGVSIHIYIYIHPHFCPILKEQQKLLKAEQAVEEQRKREADFCVLSIWV